MSDCIPVRGRKRIPYLLISTVLSLVPWLMLGLNVTLRSSKWNLMTLLTVQNLGTAMADVVIDAMIAEAVRHERYVINHKIQSSVLFYLLSCMKLEFCIEHFVRFMLSIS